MDRKEIIKLAKEDIVRFSAMKHENGSLRFIVNRKKSKVTGYIQSSYFDKMHIMNCKTSTKCHKEDTFNEFIGKAIVAYKIFEQPIPNYYLEDYQKTTYEKGDVIVDEDNSLLVIADNEKLLGVAFDNHYCTGRIRLDYAKKKYNRFVIDDSCYIDEYEDSFNSIQTPSTLACYDRVANDCDGGCQGCSDCLLAQYYNGLRKEKPSKKEMKNYIKEMRKDRRILNKIFSDIDIQEELKKIKDGKKKK